MSNYSKMSEEELMALSGSLPNSYSKMSDNDLQKMVGGATEQGSTTNMPLNMAIGGASAGVAGLGYYAAKPWIEQASLNRREVTPFRKEVGISNKIAPEEFSTVVPKQVKILEQQNKINIKTLEQSLKDFDTNIYRTTIKDTSNNLASNFKSWRYGGFEQYAKTLEEINNTFYKTGVGVPMSADSFKENVLQRTADSLRVRGLEKEAISLEKYGAKFKSGDPIKFSQVKQAVTNLTNKNPNIKRTLVENFGEFLSKDPVVSLTPAGAKFKELQKNYIPFKEADKVMGRVLKTSEGEFNTQSITKALQEYVKGKGNPNTPKLLSYMGKGSSTIPAISGLESQAIELTNIANQRAGMSANLEKSKILSEKAKIEFLKWQKRATDITAKTKSLNRQKAGRVGAAKTGALVGGALSGLNVLSKMFSIYPYVVGGYDYSQDPEAFFAEQFTGQRLAPKGSIEREIQTGRLI